MGSQCVLNPKSMEELEEISKNNHTVIFLNRDGCPHCHDMKPIIEKGCKASGNQMKFIDCNTTKNRHCAELGQKLGIEGFPTTLAIPRGESLNNPAWAVVGSNKKEFKEKLGQTLQILKNGGGGQPSSQQPSPQPQQQPRQMHHRVPSTNIDDLIIGQVSKANKNIPTINRYEVPKKIDFCTPGRDCDHDQFEQQVVDFYNSW